MKNISLSVNLNKIALIRNSREGNFPDVVDFGKRCLDLGVQGLTAHPRPDQRHMRPDDCRLLSDLCKKFDAEFNIEGNPLAPARGSYPGLLSIVESAKPHQCTLVPDSDSQKTSDHGFNLIQDSEKIEPIVRELKSLGVRVSLFMDPDIEQIKYVKDIGADRIELYTGPFAQAYSKDKESAVKIYNQHAKAASFAASLGLGVNAGHDLNTENMQLYRQLPGLLEVSIGHALTVDALLIGINETIKNYLKVCTR